jgi:hypothetical protein
LQAYIGDMTLIFQPTVNSYRRFAPGTFAPPGLTWGYENRTTCFRLVGHDAGSLRVENRLPGADTNPYLTAAATIAAGVAGILGKIEPEPEVIGSGYAQEPARDFARSMPEAIERLRGSDFARTGWATAFRRGFSATREANTTNSAKRSRTSNCNASSTWAVNAMTGPARRLHRRHEPRGHLRRRRHHRWRGRAVRRDGVVADLGFRRWRAAVALACIHHQSPAAAAILQEPRLLRQPLAEDQQEVSDLFAGRWRRRPRERFDRVAWEWRAVRSASRCCRARRRPSNAAWPPRFCGRRTTSSSAGCLGAAVRQPLGPALRPARLSKGYTSATPQGS